MASGTIKEFKIKKLSMTSTLNQSGFPVDITGILYDTTYANAHFIGVLCHTPNITARMVRTNANDGYIAHFIQYNNAYPSNGATVSYDVFYYED